MLVPFGGGEEGPARVLFHAALGTLDYFQSLGKALAAQELGPVIGVAVADQEAYCEIEPKRLIGRVADDYADRLLAESELLDPEKTPNRWRRVERFFARRRQPRHRVRA